MSLLWPEALIEEIKLFDEHEAPHGLYGVQAAYASNENWPTFAHVFASRNPNVFRTFASRWTVSAQDTVRLEIHDAFTYIRIVDFASTKIRKFGSTYRRDSSFTKKTRRSQARLDKMIPNLRKSTNRCLSTHALLLIAHAPTELEIVTHVGKAAEQDFIARYDIELTSETWPDLYGRDFFTGVYLWIVTNEKAEQHAEGDTPVRAP